LIRESTAETGEMQRDSGSNVKEFLGRRIQ